MMEGLQSEAAKQAMEQEDATESRIENLRKEMEEGQKATRAELDRLQAKQDELKKIRSPEGFFKFMKEEGITQEDIQRIFSGDQDHMQTRFNETLEQKEAKKASEKSLAALKKVDEVHGALFVTSKEEPEEKVPEEVPQKPARRAPSPPKEPEVTIPVYRLQYQKDEAGKYTSVELKCTLPGVADMSGINLDLSDRHLRLSTQAP